jgi:hypothetical protein
MRMANYGVVLYRDGTYEAIRTTIDPGVTDKFSNVSGVSQLIVLPYEYVQRFRSSLPYIPVGVVAEDEMIYDSFVAWVSGEEPQPHMRRQIVFKRGES